MCASALLMQGLFCGNLIYWLLLSRLAAQALLARHPGAAVTPMQKVMKRFSDPSKPQTSHRPEGAQKLVGADCTVAPCTWTRVC